MREKAFDNYKKTVTGSQIILTKVNNYLSGINEPTSVIIERDILSIVPNSLKQQYKAESIYKATFFPRIFVNTDENIGINTSMSHPTLKRKKDTPHRGAKKMKSIFNENDNDRLNKSDALDDVACRKIIDGEQLKCLNHMVRLSHVELTKFVCPVCKVVKSSMSAISYHIKFNHMQQLKSVPQNLPINSSTLNVKKSFEVLRDSSNDSGTYFSDETIYEKQENEPKVESPVITISDDDIDTSADSLISETTQQDGESTASTSRKESYRYKCRDPTFNRAQQEMLAYLMKESFVDYEEFKCIFCSQLFKSQRSAATHLKYHHILKGKTCIKRWISRETKKGKFSNQKNGVKSYEWHCGMCGNVYETHNGLYNHIKIRHANILGKRVNK